MTPDARTIGGAVLIGGASRRMGTDKARVEIDGRPMALRCADAMHEGGLSPVVTIGGSLPTVEFMGLSHRLDEWPGAGPLGALISALDQMNTHVVVVLSCDLLNPSAAAIREVGESLQSHDVAIPVVDGREQWLHGAWRRSARGPLRQQFEDGERSIRGAVADLDVIRFEGGDPTHYRDADRPSDLPSSGPLSSG